MAIQYRLYRFSQPSGEQEFVIISAESEADVIAEYADAEIDFDRSVEIIGDASDFPCDRTLTV